MVKCSKCSHSFDEKLGLCPVCYQPIYPRIVLIALSGNKRSFGETTQIGRALVRAICGDEDARFADTKEQFVLELSDDKKWRVLPGKGVNPTFLNGKTLIEPAVLQTNDILSIGAFYARMAVSID